MSLDVLVGLMVTLYLFGAFMSWSLAFMDCYLSGRRLAVFTVLWPLMALYIVVVGIVQFCVESVREA